MTKTFPTWRLSLAALVTAAVLYIPWLGYQEFIDPPGDRLIKMHLAGVEKQDDLSPIQSILVAYSETTLSEMSQKKWLNVKFLFGTGSQEGFRRIISQFQTGSITDGILQIRTEFFFRLFFTLFIPLLSILAIPTNWKKFKIAFKDEIGKLLLIGVISLFTWILLLFGYPESISAIHHGSLFVPLILMIALYLLAFRLSKNWAYFLLTLQGLSFLLWIPLIPSGQESPAEHLLVSNGFQPGFGILAGLGLMGLIFTLIAGQILPGKDRVRPAA